MAKVDARDLPRLIKGGWKNHPVILVYGSDEGGVREAAAAIAAAAAGPSADALNHVVLTGDALAADPPRLADEARAISMFGGFRVIHVRDAAKTPASAVEALADEPPVDAMVLIEAGDLKKDQALRKLAERHRRIACIGIYADSGRAIAGLVDEVLGGAGLGIERDARVLLASALGADRSLSRSELDKLVLYAQGEQTVTAGMVTDIVADAGRHDASTLIDRAFAGDLAFVEGEANRLFVAGTNPSAILTMAIGHAFFLRRALRTGTDAASRAGRIHFSRVDMIERAVRRWDEARLAKALGLLDEALRASRQAARLAPAITIRALWATARLSANAAD